MVGVSLKQLKKLNSKYDLNKYDQDYVAYIEAYQLKKINQVWKNCYKNIPYYNKLKQENNLPDTFDSLSQYINSIPFLTKKIVQSQKDQICDPIKKSDFNRITGGSTSSPIQMSSWKSELNSTRLTTHLGRLWYGIEPGDKLFLFWGHSHLLGNGIKKIINLIDRYLKDKIQNYSRFSCYDLSTKNLKRAGGEILKKKIDYVIGYSSALDRLARTNTQRKSDFKNLKIKAIIGAGESFPYPDSQKIVSEVFGSRVAMEYGSVESNLIAHTHPLGGYLCFWRDFLLEVDESKGYFEVVITSLYQRKTPLIRYKLGDNISFDNESIFSKSGSIIKFCSVLGRNNAPVILKSGRKLHSESISHMVRDIKGVTGYQIICNQHKLSLNITTNPSVDLNSIKADILKKSLNIDLEFSETVTINKVDSLIQSISGKNRMVIYEE
jgi:phenylacetate-coenzyme A ligase PaaK-like adenylate-forming protein